MILIVTANPSGQIEMAYGHLDISSSVAMNSILIYNKYN